MSDNPKRETNCGAVCTCSVVTASLNCQPSVSGTTPTNTVSYVCL